MNNDKCIKFTVVYIFPVLELSCLFGLFFLTFRTPSHQFLNPPNSISWHSYLNTIDSLFSRHIFVHFVYCFVLAHFKNRSCTGFYLKWNIFNDKICTVLKGILMSENFNSECKNLLALRSVLASGIWIQIVDYLVGAFWAFNI